MDDSQLLNLISSFTDELNSCESDTNCRKKSIQKLGVEMDVLQAEFVDLQSDGDILRQYLNDYKMLASSSSPIHRLPNEILEPSNGGMSPHSRSLYRTTHLAGRHPSPPPPAIRAYLGSWLVRWFCIRIYGSLNMEWVLEKVRVGAKKDWVRIFWQRALVAAFAADARARASDCYKRRRGDIWMCTETK